MHKSQIFFYLLSVFISGVSISSFGLLSQTVILILAIAGILVIAVSYNFKYGMLIGFLVLAFSAGGARFNHLNLIENSLAGYINREVVLLGYIDSEPEIDGNRVRFIFKSGRERILVTTNAFPKREFGDKLELSGKLELPKNFASSTGSGYAEFDYVVYLKKEGVGTVIFYPEEIKEGRFDLGRSRSVKLYIYRNIFVLKNKFQNVINLAVPEPNAAFINGILLGTRQNIPEDLKEAFSKTGTTHILAISGYNIMIISEAILLGLIWFFRRRVAFWISVAAIILFVIMTGASASVVRAAIMGLILSFAHGYGRLYDQKNSILLAGAVMIWINPFVLAFDIGFQLSFAAVLGLIYLYPTIDRRLYKIPKLGNLKEITVMTLSAQLAVLPLILYYFGNFSLISLPANILILPFIPAAMSAGFITGLAGIIFLPLGQIFGSIAWAITTYQIWIVNFLA